jgi:protein involved in polysaccharide export with SLBB domain
MIMRQAGWELQRSVAISGQVKFPGRYSLKSKTDRVSDLIQRAGGLTDEAYKEGVQFYRRYTAGRPTGGDPLSPIDSGVAIPVRGGSDTVTRSAPERIGIDLARVLKDPKFQDNIILMGGDSLNIPEYDPVVFVNGYVNSPGPVAYEPGKNLDWYVDRAGGYTALGDRNRPYVTQADGEREGVKRKNILADHLPTPTPGSVVFVPRKLVQDQPSTLPSVLATFAQVLGVVTTIIVVATRK